MSTQTTSRLAYGALSVLAVALATPAVLLLSSQQSFEVGRTNACVSAIVGLCGAFITLQLAMFLAARRRVASERRLADELRAAQARQAALLSDVGMALAGKDDMPVALERCAAAIVGHLDAAFARIWTLSKDGSALELQASAGVYPRLDGIPGRVRLGQLEIGRIAQDRQPYATNDLGNDRPIGDPAWAEKEGMGAFAGYPLLAGDRLVGVVAVFSRQPIPPARLHALGSITDALAQGIEHIRAAAALRKSEAFFSEGQRLSHTGSWAWIAATQELVWSEEHCRLLGYDPATTKPSLELFWQRVHPEDLAWMQHDFDQALRDKR